MAKFALLITILSVIAVSTSVGFEMYYFHSLPGIFYDHMGPVKVYDKILMISVDLNVTLVNQKVNVLKEAYLQTNHLCSNETYIFCDADQITSKLWEIERRVDQFYNEIGYDQYIKDVNLKITDTTYKFLWGELDEFGPTSTYFSGSVNQKMKFESTDVAKMKKLFQNSIDLLNEPTSNSTDLKIKLFDQFITTCDQMFEEISTLLSATMEFKKGILSSPIFEPTEFISKLEYSASTMPNGTTFPFALNESNVANILAVSKFSIVCWDTKDIYFQISIPLFEDAQFQLYQMIPLLTPVQGLIYVFFQPKFKYLAVDDTKSYYTTVKSCKTYSIGPKFCYHHKKILSVHENPICETMIFRPNFDFRNDTQICEKRLVRVQKDMWYHLYNKDEWLYVLPGFRDINVECENKKNYTDVTAGTGLMIMNKEKKCVAYVNGMQMFANSTVDIKLNSVWFYGAFNFNQVNDINFDGVLREPNPFLSYDDLLQESLEVNLAIQLSEDLSKELQHRKLWNKLSQFGQGLLIVIGGAHIVYLIYFVLKIVLRKQKSYEKLSTESSPVNV